MADIITRSGKGAALTHAEMDQNLTNLNDEIASNQADALVKLSGRSEAQIMALAAANRSKFSGSGIIHQGKMYSAASLQVVNEGLAGKIDQPNLMRWGDPAGTLGNSVTQYPVLNVQGFEIHVSGVYDTVEYRNQILFPAAPAISSLLERQDLMFPEIFFEKVSDKNFVYSFGGIQRLVATDPSTGLTTVAGNFVGYETYSLFGNWQSSGALVGKGLVWSSMSDANKQLFISDPRNNMFLAADGEWIQIRYRIRVIEGLGADWEAIKPQNSLRPTLSYDFSEATTYISARGKTTAAVDYGTSPAVYYGTYHSSGLGGVGHFSAGLSGFTVPGVAYKGLCFAIPLALVSRRNQGAFHNVFNPNGSTAWAVSSDAVSISGARPFWDVASVNFYAPTTVEDCFNPLANSDAYASGYHSGSGFIGSGLTNDSGRPDGKYYDAIYSDDVLDLRSSAHKVELSRTLDREFNRLVAGEVRGWENGKYTYPITTITDADNTAATAITLPAGTSLQAGDKIYVGNGSGGFTALTFKSYSTTTIVFVLETFNRINGESLIITESRNPSSKELLHCDIIGDPSDYYPGHYDYLSSDGTQTINYGDVIKVVDGYVGVGGVAGHFYKRIGGTNSIDLGSAGYSTTEAYEDLGTDREDSWITNGVFGTPLIVGENGEDYIPDGVSKNYKLSRKAKTLYNLLYSTDNGTTWTDLGSSTNWNFSTTLNALQSRTFVVGAIYLAFYTTEASPFETADNAEVLFKSNEVFGSSSLLSSHLISNLIGKVPVVNLGSAGFSTLISSALSVPSLEFSDSTSIGRQPEHNDVTKYLTAAKVPAAKVLSYLTRENGKLYLQLLFKEMVYDTTLDNTTEFTDIDGTTSQTYTVGEYYNITGLEQEVAVYCVYTTTNIFTGYRETEDGKFINTAGTVIFIRWDGNGWGDDNKFNVVDGISTTTDDNGNTGLIGQMRIELPFHIEDAA